jgi:hypothetical protein
MSCQNCRKEPTDTQCYFGRMADSRPFTDWTPNCTKVYTNFVNNDFKSSHDQRQYLINNANTIIQSERDRLINCSCFLPTEKGTSLEEKTIQSCNKRYCTFANNGENGLGIGRNYNNI